MSSITDEFKWVVYGLRLHDSYEYRYVGYTTVGIKQRLTTHRYDSRKKNMPVHFWIRKHPEKWQICIDILEICPEGDLQFLGQREQFWIATCREQKDREKPLLNANDGGVGGVSRRLSDEHKRKISEGLKNSTKPRKPVSDEAKRKMSEAHKGVPLTDQTKATMSDGRRKGANHHRYGKPMPDHVKEALVRAATGRVHSEEERKKRGDAHRGKPKRSGHTRWHQDRFVDTCMWCREEISEEH